MDGHRAYIAMAYIVVAYNDKHTGRQTCGGADMQTCRQAHLRLVHCQRPCKCERHLQADSTTTACIKLQGTRANARGRRGPEVGPGMGARGLREQGGQAAPGTQPAQGNQRPGGNRPCTRGPQARCRRVEARCEKLWPIDHES